MLFRAPHSKCVRKALQSSPVTAANAALFCSAPNPYPSALGGCGDWSLLVRRHSCRDNSGLVGRETGPSGEHPS